MVVCKQDRVLSSFEDAMKQSLRLRQCLLGAPPFQKLRHLPCNGHEHFEKFRIAIQALAGEGFDHPQQFTSCNRYAHARMKARLRSSRASRHTKIVCEIGDPKWCCHRPCFSWHPLADHEV